MANITITVAIDNLTNEELDVMPDKVQKILTTATQDGTLAGKIDTVEELDREEDENDSENED
jgi:hypothetical protein